MSWVSRMVEERLANAAAAGELDAPTLAGKPLPDIDQQRPQGWWADQFVRRELSHDRRQAAEQAASVARAGFWRARSADALLDEVRRANEAIVRANINLIPGDRLTLFDHDDIVARWRRLRTR